MKFADSPSGWGQVTRLLHWLMAALILGMLALGFWMVWVEDDLVDLYLETQWHKSFGFAVFALALLRLAWRAASPARPDLPGAMPVWQVRAARFSHLLLYALMLALPLSGWLMVTASPLNDADAVPFQILNQVFGLFDLPDLFPKGNAALETRLKTLHGTLALALAALLAVHAAAALRHHFADRDRVLMRMLTGQ